ncbi:XrtA/PEP-CTERM system histidine kinase PrsK [Novosphingobium tardum]|uniref:histidine kinase n=1 Tax=Novosphingobium tardum TaxID=1538021 RepID=A0ABV8RSV7_9SPHN
MTSIPASGWETFGFGAFIAGGFACAVLATWSWHRRDRDTPGGDALMIALSVTALWSLLAAATGPDGIPAALFETLRNLSWLAVVYRLFARDGRHTRVGPIRPVVAALVLVEILHIGLLLMAARLSAGHAAQDTIFHLAAMFPVMFAIGALMLVHNLYVGSLGTARAAIRWSAAGLAAIWIYDLNFYTVTYLIERPPVELASLRGLVGLFVSALLAIGNGRAAQRPFLPSRDVAFQSLSLLVIGIYLVTMVAAAQSLSYLGGDAGPLAQIGFVFTTSVLALVVLPSGRLRGWLKVTVAKHLFQHRYDYRAEWLRFTRTVGRADSVLPLEERVIQAVADITDSPAGLLLTQGEHGELSLSARWQWRTIDVPATAMGAPAVRFFERDGFIVDLDQVRSGHSQRGECGVLPAWLVEDEAAWAVVPLIHFDRLVGVVVLTRPPLARQLDWEDFDLLRVVGQQLASYLAEHAGQEALLDASRFDEFNRRIAFVMHDIKNLASQLTLLARNAERHADNPDFRADMLVTLRNSGEKLNALLARLSRYGANQLDRLDEVDAVDVARRVIASLKQQHAVVLLEAHDCRVIAQRDTLEQVLTHLVQNAIDASEANAPVYLKVTSNGLHGSIEVIDSGSGMSADFVRNRLFKPFVSTKAGGFGIGAFEARELVRAMQGRLDVESREGLGSRFIVRLPLLAAASLLRAFDEGSSPTSSDSEQKVA